MSLQGEEEGPSAKKRRTVQSENREFQTRWEELYFCMAVEKKPVCLVCNHKLTVNKEYNLRRHYESQHGDLAQLSLANRYKRLFELKQNFNDKIRCERNSRDVNKSNKNNDCDNRSDAALRASFVVSDILLRKGKPYTDGPLIKECMIKAAEILCPEETQKFQSISLSPNTIAERSNDIAADLDSQLRERCAKFRYFSLALDESTDVVDTAQLAIFIRGVENEGFVTEELLSLVPLNGTTTGRDIFEALEQTFQTYNLSWERFVGFASDGAPSMKGDKKEGLVALVRKHLKSLGLPDDFKHIHCIVHQEALCAGSLKGENVMNVVVKVVNKIRTVGLSHRQFRTFLEDIGADYEDLPYFNKTRWLSRAKVLKRVFEMREIIIDFFQEKKIFLFPELEDPKWTQELAFMVDMTAHLNELNLKLQGKDKLINNAYKEVKGFQMRLEAYEEEIRKAELFHFPSLAGLGVLEDTNMNTFGDVVSNLKKHFQNSFQDFQKFEKDIQLFERPFSVKIPNVPPILKNDLIDLQIDDSQKDRFHSVPLQEFYSSLDGVKFKELKNHALKMIALFCSTYICEQFFSLMKYTKNRFRSRLTDENLLNQLRIMSRNNLEPDFNELMLKRRSQVSSSSTHLH